MPGGIPSWAWVTGLTAGAVVAVAALAVQADHGTQPHTTAASHASASASPSPHPTATKTAPPTVPDGSGTGRRIVYALKQHRVWLVDASDKATRTFTVWPGTVDPAVGKYAVGTRTDATTGSDGVKIAHVMYFGVGASGVNFAFSNALDGSSPPPAAAGTQTGGIRMKVADGSAVWTFGTAGTAVVVVA
ncbi:hypothetical protein ACIQU5_10505 [Streptomyces sp. NPDC090306]|uniref:hypothetical protein n=1 Tax=Streptomyces sp. NPDC090306 TaxID=3365961 RepID=UPI00382BFD2F